MRRPLIVLVLILAAVLGFNLLRLPVETPPSAPPAKIALDEQVLAARLAEAVRIASVSLQDAPAGGGRFAELRALLQREFPRVHAELRCEQVGDSLLYTWTGRDAAAKPALMAAHLDVVPVAPDSEARWTHPPFAGVIADGYVWGRGTLDDKSSAIAWMEAAEHLLADGFQPYQTVYFAFGHDEEVGGGEGAARIAELLQSRSVRLDYVLDEGGVIGENLMAGVSRPVATIMTAEKGYATFRLSTHDIGGHSSMPPPQTAVTRLIAALDRLQQRPMPARLTPPVVGLLTPIARQLPFASRLAIANRWLFAPLLVRQLQQAPVTNALVRTTMTPTVVAAGIKDNVIPAEAHALLNVRMLPGDSLDKVRAHLRKAIADEAVQIELMSDWHEEASAAASSDSPAFRTLARSVAQVFPDALVATGLVVGATDARHYARIADNRYNFMPVRMNAADLERLHGIDERIGIKGYADMVRYDMSLLQNMGNGSS